MAFTYGKQTKTGDANEGNRAVGVPVTTLNLGAEWDTPFVRFLTLTGRVIYTSKQYVDAANTQRIPGWTRLDLGARYAWFRPGAKDPIVFRFAVENVLNKNYWQGASQGFLSMGLPRTFLLSTSFSF